MSESFPSLENSGPVTEIIRENPTFDDIPILKSFHKDAGKFITFGLTASQHPETGIRNLGVYRIQIVDSTRALMHWQKHSRGAEHHDLTKSTTTVCVI
jgi:3-octaprenyl-4hydroxybenzoate decarboxylase (EC 4.1.1.-)